MSYSPPKRVARRRGTVSVHRVRRHRLPVGGVLTVALATATLVVSGRGASGESRAQQDARRGSATAAAAVKGQGLSSYLARVRWPGQGQAALALGGAAAASPGEQAVPIASVTKVMTAYLVLARYPLSPGQQGFTVTISAAEAREEARDASEDQSVLAVAPGERLSERQLLEGLLIPSGNNVARLLAAKVAGSVPSFVAGMNAEARVLGMKHTTYTDPSGWESSTISTAADQLRIFERAIRLPAFRQIVSMAAVTLPVAGTLNNTNPLIAAGYAGKTGSDSAAGACLAFFTRVTVAGRRVTATGVVLGQWQPGSSAVILAAAGGAAQRLIGSLSGAAGAVTATGADGGQSNGLRAGQPPRSPSGGRQWHHPPRP